MSYIIDSFHTWKKINAVSNLTWLSLDRLNLIQIKGTIVDEQEQIGLSEFQFDCIVTHRYSKSC